jgi:hypothetical protein
MLVVLFTPDELDTAWLAYTVAPEAPVTAAQWHIPGPTAVWLGSLWRAHHTRSYVLCRGNRAKPAVLGRREVSEVYYERFCDPPKLRHLALGDRGAVLPKWYGSLLHT